MVKKKRQSDAMNNDGSSTDSSDERPLQSPGSASGGCQHVKKSVDTTKLRKALKTTGLSLDCAQCSKSGASDGVASPAVEANEDDSIGFEYDNTLWVCLKCGTQLCGRSKNQHALQHFKTPHSDSHAMTMNTRSFEIWCYECDNEVSANIRKNLLECVEIVKKAAQKPLPAEAGTNELPNCSVNDIEGKILATWETLRPLVPIDGSTTIINNCTNQAIPLPPPPPPPSSSTTTAATTTTSTTAIPGMAKRINYPATAKLSTLVGLKVAGTSAVQRNDPNADQSVEVLPRVRGLTNLGNTCFFNAVMQCLAQTPYLLDVLKESAEPGEQFILPGGNFKFKDNDDVQLPMIKGTLMGWGSLTSALAQALEELQSGGGVFTPGKLFEKLCHKCPQFRGGDQHDSHELLRHLLESVRAEDLKRYQRVILQNLGYKDQDINSVSEEMRQKCKIYGNQAADRILRPEQVFRGFLVSTLTCQDCYNVSSRHEYFLDMSLPVSMDKPQPPQRRKISPDNEPLTAMFFNNQSQSSSGPTKSQLKKDKLKERKAKRTAKHHNQKLAQKLMLEDVTGAAGDATTDDPTTTRPDGSACSSSTSTSEQSDADVEDNLIDDNNGGTQQKNGNAVQRSTHYDPNGNNAHLVSPCNPEKRDDSPENLNKDSQHEDDENDSGIATSPANAGSSFTPSSDTNGGGGGGVGGAGIVSDINTVTPNNSVVNVGLSEKGANKIRQLTLVDNTLTASVAGVGPLTNGDLNGDNNATLMTAQFNELQLIEQEQLAAKRKAKRSRTQSYSDWSTTIAPRYQCDDGECSVQSCLNSFTGVELMTGNNKVGCDNCTKRINGGDNLKAKTVNTNATKQFLISSPPAVLILHLKRFQLGFRCNFRKLTRAVSFPMVLDIAPFCGSKVKNLPNIDRGQKKLVYALYGIVEHSGGMYGGHYTAFVKVRSKLSPDDKRWKFIPQGSKAELDQDDEQRKKLDELLAKEKARELRMKAANDSDDFSNSCGSSTDSSTEPDDPLPKTTVKDNTEQHDDQQQQQQHGAVGGDEDMQGIQVPMGKWYFVSDSRVQEVNEETVLKSQAYLLFYERIY